IGGGNFLDRAGFGGEERGWATFGAQAQDPIKADTGGKQQADRNQRTGQSAVQLQATPWGGPDIVHLGGAGIARLANGRIDPADIGAGGFDGGKNGFVRSGKLSWRRGCGG